MSGRTAAPTPVTSTTAATPIPQSLPVEGDRLPRVGDTVRFHGYSIDEDDLHAVVSRTFGYTVNLAYLNPSGSWLSAGRVPLDASGATSGSWRWPTL